MRGAADPLECSTLRAARPESAANIEAVEPSDSPDLPLPPAPLAATGYSPHTAPAARPIPELFPQFGRRTLGPGLAPAAPATTRLRQYGELTTTRPALARSVEKARRAAGSPLPDQSSIWRSLPIWRRPPRR